MLSVSVLVGDSGNRGLVKQRRARVVEGRPQRGPVHTYTTPPQADTPCHMHAREGQHSYHKACVTSIIKVVLWGGALPTSTKVTWRQPFSSDYPPPPVPKNQQCLTAEPGVGSCAHFSP